MFKSFDHLEIGEILLFVYISLSPYNFANVWSKYVANLAASRVTLTRPANSVKWGLMQWDLVFRAHFSFAFHAQVLWTTPLHESRIF